MRYGYSVGIFIETIGKSREINAPIENRIFPAINHIAFIELLSSRDSDQAINTFEFYSLRAHLVKHFLNLAHRLFLQVLDDGVNLHTEFVLALHDHVDLGVQLHDVHLVFGVLLLNIGRH